MKLHIVLALTLGIVAARRHEMDDRLDRLMATLNVAPEMTDPKLELLAEVNGMPITFEHVGLPKPRSYAHAHAIRQIVHEESMLTSLINTFLSKSTQFVNEQIDKNMPDCYVINQEEKESADLAVAEADVWVTLEKVCGLKSMKINSLKYMGSGKMNMGFTMKPSGTASCGAGVSAKLPDLGAVGNVIDKVGDKAGDVIDNIRGGAVGNVINKVGDKAGDVIDKIGGGLGNAGNAVIDKVGDIGKTIGGWFGEEELQALRAKRNLIDDDKSVMQLTRLGPKITVSGSANPAFDIEGFGVIDVDAKVSWKTWYPNLCITLATFKLTFTKTEVKPNIDIDLAGKFSLIGSAVDGGIEILLNTAGAKAFKAGMKAVQPMIDNTLNKERTQINSKWPLSPKCS